MGEITQDTNQKVTVRVDKPCFSLYYGLFTYLNYGIIEKSELRKHLLSIKQLLIEKYGEEDYRVKFLFLTILKLESGEFEIDDREMIRYILHAECEPEDPHTSLLEDLKERMEVER